MGMLSKKYRNCPTGAYVGRATAMQEKVVSAPDPSSWSVLRLQTITGMSGSATVMMLRYPDCTNFEGRKVLVYRGEVALDLRIPRDPHFAEDGSGPIARFQPNEEGWRDAMMYAEMLVNVGKPRA